jgi:hypothetical protein
MNMSTAEVGAWQGAIKQVGGSSESAVGALAGLSGEMNRFMLTGQSSMLPVLSRLGISLFDQNRNLKTAGQLWLDIAKAVEGMDPAKATAFLSMIPGANNDMVNLLLKGPRAVEAYLEAARKAGTASKESGDQAEVFQRSLGRLGDAATNAGRAVMAYLYPSLTWLADKLRELIQLNPTAAGVIGTLGALFGIRAAWRGARGLLTRGGAAAAAAEGAGAAAGAAGASGAGVAAGTAAGATARGLGRRILGRTLGPLGFLLDSEEANATEASRPYDPVTNPGGRMPVVTSPPIAPAPGLAVKPGSGIVSPAMRRVSDVLAGVPEVKQATSYNDPFHAFLGRDSAHSAGRAVDVTIKDPNRSAEVAQKIREALAAQGINATVLDEYRNPSRGATGGHIHVGIDAPTALGLAGGAPRLGAPAAAAIAPGNVDNSNSRSSTSTVTTTIGKVEVNAPQARDGEAVARSIAPALKRTLDASVFNSGAN